MATPATFDPSTKQSSELDKSQWTELQKLQYMLGLWDGVPGSPVKTRELPPWNWVPNDEWQKGEGLLSGHPEHDTTKMKADDKAWEEEHDARKFGWGRQL